MADMKTPMGMFLQDPSLPELHDDFDFATTGDYLETTGSSRFCLRDSKFDWSGVETGPVLPALNWQRQDLSFARFDAEGLVDNPQFHQVNLFATCTRSLAMVEEELGGPITWNGGGPLVLRPHAFEDFNAFYLSPTVNELGITTPASLNFAFAVSPYRRTPVWTCLSHDIITHELGHAVLDGVRPGFGTSFDPDSGAFHESFGDLLAMFASMRHEAVVRRLFEESGGNLRNPSVLTRLAEEFGIGVTGAGFPFLRSGLEKMHYGQGDPGDVHGRSAIWTGAIYELMVRLAEARGYGVGNSFDDFVAAGVEAAKWARGMLFRVLNYTPPTGVSFPQLARLMYEADARVFGEDSQFRDVARELFIERNLWDESIDLTAPDIGDTFRPLADAGPAALAAAVLQHADELLVPRDVGARIIDSRLVSTNRCVDRVTDAEGNGRLRGVTEHYLSYTYELSLPFEQKTEFGRRVLLVPVQLGGTLVMDEDWNAVLLATDPILTAEDLASPDPLRSALHRTLQGLSARLGDQLAAAASSATNGRHPMSPGARRCDLKEHLRGVYGVTALLPFAQGR